MHQVAPWPRGVFTRCLSLFSAAVTEYHRLIYKEKKFVIVLEAGKSNIKVPVFDEGLLATLPVVEGGRARHRERENRTRS